MSLERVRKFDRNQGIKKVCGVWTVEQAENALCNAHDRMINLACKPVTQLLPLVRCHDAFHSGLQLLASSRVNSWCGTW